MSRQVFADPTANSQIIASENTVNSNSIGTAAANDAIQVSQEPVVVSVEDQSQATDDEEYPTAAEIKRQRDRDEKLRDSCMKKCLWIVCASLTLGSGGSAAALLLQKSDNLVINVLKLLGPTTGFLVIFCLIAICCSYRKTPVIAVDTSPINPSDSKPDCVRVPYSNLDATTQVAGPAESLKKTPSKSPVNPHDLEQRWKQNLWKHDNISSRDIYAFASGGNLSTLEKTARGSGHSVGITKTGKEEVLTFQAPASNLRATC